MIWVHGHKTNVGLCTRSRDLLHVRCHKRTFLERLQREEDPRGDQSGVGDRIRLLSRWGFHASVWELGGWRPVHMSNSERRGRLIAIFEMKFNT